MDAWIPISESLPDDWQNVLITIYTDNIYEVVPAIFTINNEFLPNVKIPGGYFYVDNGYDDYPCEVIAWMPFPEPYKVVKNISYLFNKGNTSDQSCLVFIKWPSPNNLKSGTILIKQYFGKQAEKAYKIVRERMYFTQKEFEELVKKVEG